MTFREAVKAEENLLILIGSELRGNDLKQLIDFGLTLPERSSLSSPTTPTRAAQPTWACCPTCCPATLRLRQHAPSPSTKLPPKPGLDMLEIFEAAGRGELSALYVVGSNPVSRYESILTSLEEHFRRRAGYVPH